MVPSYLIDTQTIRYWFDHKAEQYKAVNNAVEKLNPRSVLYVSSISLGEIEYGHCIAPSQDKKAHDSFREFIRTRLPQILPISGHTVEPYAHVRACLVEKCAPKDGWGKTKRAEQLCHPLSAKALGIQENDLWLIAQAIERNLVLVTNDAMRKLQDAVQDSRFTVRFENWCEPEDAS